MSNVIRVTFGPGAAISAPLPRERVALQTESDAPVAVASAGQGGYDPDMAQQAVPPPSVSPPASFFERVRAAVRSASLAEPRVLLAAVAPDGLEFSFHGTSRETEMYEVGAALAAEAEDRADPDAETELRGGWTRAPYPREGWVIVFSRGGQ